MAKLLGKKWLEVSKRIQEITAQALGKEELLILERHLKTLDTRAQLHVGAGLGFYERYKHACKGTRTLITCSQLETNGNVDTRLAFAIQTESEVCFALQLQSLNQVVLNICFLNAFSMLRMR